MKIIAQPCSASDSVKHYEDTVTNVVSTDILKKHLTTKIYTELLNLIGNNSFHIWGIMSGENGSNAKKWDRIETDDIAIFYKNKEFFSKGSIFYKVRCYSLANELWGNSDGKTWEYIYFFKNLSDLHLPITDFNTIMNYNSKFILQGFQIIQNPLLLMRVQNLTISDSEKVKKERLKDLRELSQTDTARVVATRNEQHHLRKYLGLTYSGIEGLNKVGTCAICNNQFPVAFLHAGHIKKRSECKDVSELLDYNIVMPICKFGCDDLFEHGLIVVDENGIIRENTKKTALIDHNENPEIIKRISMIINMNCNYYINANGDYFLWHLKYHTE